MIFLKRGQSVVWIPKHRTYDGVLTLTLKNNLTGTEFNYTDLQSVGDNKCYWIFQNMDFTNLQSGEYTYKLNDIETGLLHVVQPATNPISYKTEKTIVQYGN